MERKLFAGVVFGASSLIAGCVFYKLSEVSYLHLIPQFHNFHLLKEYLKKSPQRQADVLVEGVAQKLWNAAVYSERAEIYGAAMLETSTTNTKVHHEESRELQDMTYTMEKGHSSVRFKLEDSAENFIVVDSVHKAGGFRQILQKVYEKSLLEKLTTGDNATNNTLRTIPTESLNNQEFLLVFGTTVAGYGSAVLRSIQNSSEIVHFTPREVSSSIHSLISRNKMVSNTFRFFSLVFLIAGGSILLLTATPVVLQFLHPQQREDAVG